MILLDLLGKSVASYEVISAIEKHRLDEIEDDPPFRRYIGSKRSGLDLLLEDGLVISVQIFIAPTQGFSSFSGPLPFGLLREMTSTDIFALLGSPMEHDASSSTYVLEKMKLVVNYNQSAHVIYLNIERASVVA